MDVCKHEWSICNLRHGFLVVEGCFECGARCSFFSSEPVAPIDEYREAKHFWITLGSYQSVKFDLECAACGTVVHLDDMDGLMLSECEDRECPVGQLASRKEPGSLVFVALCRDGSHVGGRCVSSEGVEALNQYFNRNIEALDRRVRVVPCKLCNSFDKCRGTIIADEGLTGF